jgi:hypothetical protein
VVHALNAKGEFRLLQGMDYGRRKGQSVAEIAPELAVSPSWDLKKER